MSPGALQQSELDAWTLPAVPTAAHTAHSNSLSLRPANTRSEVSVTLESEEEGSDYSDAEALDESQTESLTIDSKRFILDIEDDFALNGESKRPALESGKKAGLWARRRAGRKAEIVHNIEDLVSRQTFILTLAKALLSFGAPSHRTESLLDSAAKILGVNAVFAQLPGVIIAIFGDKGTKTSEMHFVRAGGRIALSSLTSVHEVYKSVLHDRIGPEEGREALVALLKKPPVYPIWLRCLLAFGCSSIMCSISFGGSIIDMFIGGAFSAILQYLGLNAVSRSAIYANVYEISASIIVSFLARVLSTLPSKLFCYNAIASAGVTLILPGFTVLISALELTSNNVLCGSVRLIYAVIYTFFLGFGLTIGSDIYLFFNKRAQALMDELARPPADTEILTGMLTLLDGPSAGDVLNMSISIATASTRDTAHMIRGCFRDPDWPWWRHPFPIWTVLFLVPIYSLFSSLANQQRITRDLSFMIVFSCFSFAASKYAGIWVTDRVYIVAGIGAFTVGICGNIYSRFYHKTAFTCMVIGILFLVPSALSLNGGLIQQPNSSSQSPGSQYLGSFSLGLRMIQVAIGVTLGLFISQLTVYSFGRRKAGAHFAF